MVVSSVIEKAFAERPDLKKRTFDAIGTVMRLLGTTGVSILLEESSKPNSAAAQSPQHAALFNDIASYAQTLRSTSQPATNGDSPPSKKRKLDDAGSSNGTFHLPPTEWKAGYHTVPDMSFLVPKRKKLTLEIRPRLEEGLRARNPTTGAVEFGIAWKDVHHAVCVPVPEKAQRQYAFCVFPAYGDSVTSPPAGSSATEPMVWTVPDTVPKNVSLGRDGDGEQAPDGTYKGYVQRLLDSSLGLVGRKIVEPDEKEFASTLVHAHRKGEKAFHVSAFRGSKDGFLFFLPTGILYAFKKPLLFFPLDAIDSVSYTSVLQRTFNLNITTTPSALSSSSTSQNEASDRTHDFEFSMLDQADFAGIDAYVKRHALQDASMAEQRRAKRANANGTKGSEGDGGKRGEEGELEKARKEVGAKEGGAGAGEEEEEEEEEEEDEGEEGEDYDPGSEGESEGSGTSSEEEEGGDGGREGGEEGLMADELGSGGEEEEL